MLRFLRTSVELFKRPLCNKKDKIKESLQTTECGKVPNTKYNTKKKNEIF